MLKYTTSCDVYAESCIFSALSVKHVKCSEQLKKPKKVEVPVFIQAPPVKYMSTSCILSGMGPDKRQVPLLCKNVQKVGFWTISLKPL